MAPTAISWDACAHSPAARRGAAQTRTLLKTILRHNRCAIARDGDIDVAGSAALLQAKLALPEVQRLGVILALAEFVARALDGVVLDLSQWRPLETSGEV